MYLYTHTHIIHTYMHTDVQTYRHKDIRTYRHGDIQADIHMHTYIHTSILSYVHTYEGRHIRTYTHTYTHTYSGCRNLGRPDMLRFGDHFWANTAWLFSASAVQILETSWSDHTGAINNHFRAIRFEQYNGNTGPIHLQFRPIHVDSRVILLVQYSVNTVPILDQYTSFFDQYRFWPSEKLCIFHTWSAPAVCPSCPFIKVKGIIRMWA